MHSLLWSLLNIYPATGRSIVWRISRRIHVWALFTLPVPMSLFCHSDRDGMHIDLACVHVADSETRSMLDALVPEADAAVVVFDQLQSCT